MLRSSLILLMLVGMLIAVPTAQARPPFDGYLPSCTGEYFNNTTATGTPVMARTDAAINFNWLEGTSPGPGVNVDNYSVRWTCSVNVTTAGNYTFNIVTDDGMNLLLDDNLLIWAWYDQGPTGYSATASVSAGWHTVKVEYYNRVRGGTAQVWTNMPLTAIAPPPSPPPITAWQGEYFNNPSLSGAPALIRNDASINFNWTTGSPSPAIPADYFSVRWTRTISFAAGTYRFTTTTDDGVRLWIDSTLVIDKWIPQSPTSYTVDVVIPAGAHTIKMEYFEQTGGAQAKLTYAAVSGGTPTGVWQGQYFSNVSLSGAPTIVRNDAAINFNWGEGVPIPGLPADNFSVRWDSTQNIPATGDNVITATSDDGVRVWVDGVLIIDGWYDHPPTTFSTTRTLTAGAHTFRVEYYDSGYGAMINVQIGGGGVSPSEVIVDDRGPGWQAGGTGTWRGSTFGVGGHSFWTLNNTYTAYGYNWARWYPTLPAPGYYEVFAFLPDNLGTTLNARYWIYHNNRYDLAARAQGFFPNQWISLGTHYFHALGGEYVSLADVTYECYLCRSLVFDAIKFVPR